MTETNKISAIEHRSFLKLAETQVSEEHPIECVCGRLCTGLHELNCAKFRAAVEKRAKKLEKQFLKDKQRGEQ